MAVGSGFNQLSDESPIAYSWNGSTWTATLHSNGGHLRTPTPCRAPELAFCAATADNPGPVNQVT